MFMSVRALCNRAFAAVTQHTPNLSVRAQAFASITVPDTMKKVQLGNSDLQVSVACLGTMVSAPSNVTAGWFSWYHIFLYTYSVAQRARYGRISFQSL